MVLVSICHVILLGLLIRLLLDGVAGFSWRRGVRESVVPIGRFVLNDDSPLLCPDRGVAGDVSRRVTFLRDRGRTVGRTCHHGTVPGTGGNAARGRRIPARKV